MAQNSHRGMTFTDRLTMDISRVEEIKKALLAKHGLIRYS